MLVDHTLSTLFCIMPSTSAVCTNRASKEGSVVPRIMGFRTAPSTRPKFKLTHYFRVGSSAARHLTRQTLYATREENLRQRRKSAGAETASSAGSVHDAAAPAGALSDPT